MIINQFPKQDSVTALAFDYGTQRIGVAFGQSISGSAKAIGIVKAKDGIPNWDEIGQLLEEWKPDILVVGLPYNLDGSDSELLLRATKFGKRLNGRFGIPCYGMDERLSSKEAVDLMQRESGNSKKRAAIDDIAAQIILQNWFNEFSRN